MDFEKLYYTLFNAITDAIQEIEKSRVITQEMYNGIKLLRKAQESAETYFIESQE